MKGSAMIASALPLLVVIAAIVVFGATGNLSVVSHASVLTLAIGSVVTAVVISRVVVEERLLRARYSDYGDYARSTKALVPFVF
jgi:protein-S-isoprenylcysteine O-methyltransferase Ste14